MIRSRFRATICSTSYLVCQHESDVLPDLEIGGSVTGRSREKMGMVLEHGSEMGELGRVYNGSRGQTLRLDIVDCDLLGSSE